VTTAATGGGAAAATVAATGAAAAPGGVLVMGYGNGLRSDDGVGPAVAAYLRADPRMACVDVRTAHQLTPELSLDVSGASLVVLVDAALGLPAGEVAVRQLGKDEGADGEVMTHHVGPAGIVGLSRELWGAAPPVVIVSVGVATLEVGDGLSSVVEAAIPRAAAAVIAAIEAGTGAGIGAGARA
jgi:hydrogenase maturation protease